eukprot:scaffold25305_cov99-Isochrysis_galbana.AAC.1
MPPSSLHSNLRHRVPFVRGGGLPRTVLHPADSAVDPRCPRPRPRRCPPPPAVPPGGGRKNLGAPTAVNVPAVNVPAVNGRAPTPTCPLLKTHRAKAPRTHPQHRPPPPILRPPRPRQGLVAVESDATATGVLKGWDCPPASPTAAISRSGDWMRRQGRRGREKRRASQTKGEEARGAALRRRRRCGGRRLRRGRRRREGLGGGGSGRARGAGPSPPRPGPVSPAAPRERRCTAPPLWSEIARTG